MSVSCSPIICSAASWMVLHSPRQLPTWRIAKGGLKAAALPTFGWQACGVLGAQRTHGWHLLAARCPAAASLRPAQAAPGSGAHRVHLHDRQPVPPLHQVQPGNPLALGAPGNGNPLHALDDRLLLQLQAGRGRAKPASDRCGVRPLSLLGRGAPLLLAAVRRSLVAGSARLAAPHRVACVGGLGHLPDLLPGILGQQLTHLQHAVRNGRRQGRVSRGSPFASAWMLTHKL